MRKAITCLFLSIITLALLCSCTPKNPFPSDENPDIGIPNEEINSRFYLFTTKGSGNTYKNGDQLRFFASLSNSEYSIAFDTYEYVRIFTRENDKWKEYLYEYYSSNSQDGLPEHTWEFFLDKKQLEETGLTYQSLLPDIPDLEKPTWFRIFLIGYLYENNTLLDQKTAAYFDVLLRPK